MGSFNEDISNQLNKMKEDYLARLTPAQAPQVNENYQKILDEQKKTASDFRQNIPKYSTTLGNQYEAQARKNLAQSLKNTDRDFNKRGLLYSGMRLGNEAEQQGEAASNVAQGKQQINKGLLDQANQLDAGVLNTAAGIAGQGTQQGLYQGQMDIMNLKNQIQQEQMQSQAMGSLLGGIGTLGGAAIGSAFNNPGLGFNSYPSGGYSQPNSYSLGVNTMMPSMGIPSVLSGFYQFSGK